MPNLRSLTYEDEISEAFMDGPKPPKEPVFKPDPRPLFASICGYLRWHYSLVDNPK